MDKKNVLLVDGNLLMFKSFYATYRPDTGMFKNSNDIPTNAIHLFLISLFKIISYKKPSHIFIAFDAPGGTFRHEFFSEYKGNRKKAPDELYEQFTYIKEILNTLDIKYLEEFNIEADDLIASWIDKIDKEKYDITVFSADKDLLQLVGKNVEIISKWDKNDYLVVNENNFYENYNFLPNQVADYKALVGDSSDNFPGVKGIGPKVAQTLLNKYKTIEEIYNNLDLLSQSIRQKLIDNKDSAFLCKKLAQLVRDFNFSFDFSNIEYKYQIRNDALMLLDKFELNRCTKSYKDLINGFKQD